MDNFLEIRAKIPVPDVAFCLRIDEKEHTFKVLKQIFTDGSKRDSMIGFSQQTYNCTREIHFYSSISPTEIKAV